MPRIPGSARRGRSLAYAVALALALALLSFGSSACVSGGGTGGGETPSQPFVAIDPEEARLASASSALSAQVGHAISYEVDPTLVREHEARIRELVAQAIESAAMAVARVRQEAPAEAATACLVFSKLHIERNERVRDPSAVFDPAEGKLTILVPTAAATFGDEARIGEALLTSTER